jgi:hypothetical protein
MADIKKVYLKKKIEGVVYDIYARSSADMIDYNNTTVSATLSQFATDLSNVITSSTVDTKIKTATDELYNKIMGLTSTDTTINEAYDTLKEVATYIEQHANATSGYATLLSTVGDSSSGLVKDVADLKTTVGDSNSGLVKAVAELQTTVANTDKSKVTASTTNGNIKVDGSEMTVYTHPETHAATMIVEDDTHKFVTSTEKAKIAAAATVEYVTAMPDTVSDVALYLVEA